MAHDLYHHQYDCVGLYVLKLNMAVIWNPQYPQKNLELYKLFFFRLELIWTRAVFTAQVKGGKMDEKIKATAEQTAELM